MGLVWVWGCYQSATADRLPLWWRVAERVSAYAYLPGGKRVPLPCVEDREVAGVRTEAAFIRSVWTELRGPGWQPGPDAEARIARAAARREWWARSAWANVVIGTATLAGVALLVVLLS
ncbi:hypothetical protein ACFVX6_36340 [Streptomyces sp. NPDC058289]|uniref:hypothetical protein n=1 Tax=Streptomyces sp. NPDC058289 TaxID=3346425 RepID=UPI0036E7BD6D